MCPWASVCLWACKVERLADRQTERSSRMRVLCSKHSVCDIYISISVYYQLLTIYSLLYN